MRKEAGLVTNAVLAATYHGNVCLYGRLLEDTRGTHYDGTARDFSGKDIRTSVVESVVYHREEDYTEVFTLNSIYRVEGNLIRFTFPDYDKDVIGGEDILDLFNTLEA